MKLLSLVLMLTVVGCSKTSDSASSPFAGIWMLEDNAVELRQTGKVESLCPEIRKNPTVQITNVRLISRHGSTYMYHPSYGPIPQVKMGELAADGTYKPMGPEKEAIGNLSVSVTVNGNKLTFHYGKDIATNYLRSGVEEARAYYNSQEACRKN